MDFTFKVLNNTRKKFSEIITNNSTQDLNKIPKGFNNNIIWNIGHVVVTLELLAYKLSDLPIKIDIKLIDKYKKGTTPLTSITEEEIIEIKNLLSTTLENTKKDYNTGVFKNYTAYTVSTTGNTLNNINEAIEFAAIHEGLHYGYVLALLKAIKNNL